ncbi:MAG: LptF/LptG family permease, partial [Thermoguttaceae bacterium]|nr:LptF/LptG family permease [Thermoguttaceae bacterium]
VIGTMFNQGIPVSLAFKLLPYLMPEFLTMMIPVAALLSTTLFFAHVNGSNELIALKALGVPPWKIMLPVWVLMFLISIGSVWLYDYGMSQAKIEMGRVIIEEFETTLIKKLKTDHNFTTPDHSLSIKVREVREDGQLINLKFSRVEDNKRTEGLASKARISVDLKGTEPSLVFQLIDIEIKTPEGLTRFAEINHHLPLGSFVKKIYRSDPSMSQIKEELEKIEFRRQQYRRKLAALTSYAVLTGNYDKLSDPLFQNRVNFENNLDFEKNRCQLAIPRRWSSGFSCFFFVWVGIPFAIWMNKKDASESFFYCFLPILGIYYPLLMVGLSGAKEGILLPAFIWSGNVVLGLIGIWFLRKIHQY